MNYCSTCGAPVGPRVPPGDDRPRYVCDRCHTIHYENPKMVVGCIPEWKDKVLLCRRAIEPRSGLWTIPAGFLENGETVIEGAKREAFEEARARVDILDLYTLFDLTHVHQVYLIFRARLLDDRYMAGEETAEVKLFEEEEMPWDEIAFPSIKKALRLYFQDRSTGTFLLHIETIPPSKRLSPGDLGR